MSQNLLKERSTFFGDTALRCGLRRAWPRSDVDVTLDQIKLRDIQYFAVIQAVTWSPLCPFLQPTPPGSRKWPNILGMEEDTQLILLSNIDLTHEGGVRSRAKSFRAWPSERVLLDAKTFSALKSDCQDLLIGSNRGCASMAFDKLTLIINSGTIDALYFSQNTTPLMRHEEWRYQFARKSEAIAAEHSPFVDIIGSSSRS